MVREMELHLELLMGPTMVLLLDQPLEPHSARRLD